MTRPVTSQTPSTLSRRHFALAGTSLLALPILGACTSTPLGRAPISVGGLFAGRIDDHGFMEAGWRGLERAPHRTGRNHPPH
jgi:basic membrane protein A